MSKSKPGFEQVREIPTAVQTVGPADHPPNAALIERIVADILSDQKELNRLAFEQEGLDRDRRSLSWPERGRRYAVQGEVSRLQNRLEEEIKELDTLGTVLMSPQTGLVGFPTIVNGKAAYFSWQVGEKGVSYWHFDGEDARRRFRRTGWTNPRCAWRTTAEVACGLAKRPSRKRFGKKNQKKKVVRFASGKMVI